MNPTNPTTRSNQPLPRKQVEKILRDAAFVLWLTRRTKREILQETAIEPAERTTFQPTEDQPPFTAA